MWAIASLWVWLQNVPKWIHSLCRYRQRKSSGSLLCSKKSNFTFLFFKTDRHHGYVTVLFGRITMPFLKSTTSVPLFFVILQCFLLYVSFLSASVLFGNVLHSFIRRHSDDNCLATKGAEATTRTTTTAESNRLDQQNNNFACTSLALFCTVSS